jgi:hypothetical protein
MAVCLMTTIRLEQWDDEVEDEPQRRQRLRSSATSP